MLKVPYGKGAIPLTTYATVRRWVDLVRGRRAPQQHGAAGRSSLRSVSVIRRRRRRASERAALIGHDIHVDGVTPSRMTSKPTSQTE